MTEVRLTLDGSSEAVLVMPTRAVDDDSFAIYSGFVEVEGPARVDWIDADGQVVQTTSVQLDLCRSACG